MNLRWIERDGQKILQKRNELVNLTSFPPQKLWLDVPEFKEPEKTVTITESVFDKVWREYISAEGSSGNYYWKDKKSSVKKELGF
jgi:hypothetical protein